MRQRGFALTRINRNWKLEIEDLRMSLRSVNLYSLGHSSQQLAGLVISLALNGTPLLTAGHSVMVFYNRSAGFRLVEPTARREADLKYSIFNRQYSMILVHAFNPWPPGLHTPLSPMSLWWPLSCTPQAWKNKLAGLSVGPSDRHW